MKYYVVMYTVNGCPMELHNEVISEDKLDSYMKNKNLYIINFHEYN